LADPFSDPALHMWSYDPTSRAPALHGKHDRVPLKPFAGTIGCAPAALCLHSVVAPRRFGDNLDFRDLAAGTTLYLPIEVRGTAIESPTMDMALTLDLMKGANLKTLSFTTPGPVTDHLDTKGYEVTIGICLDRMSRPRNAVSPMIDHLCATRGLSPVHAYMLMSAFISTGPCSNERHVLDTLDNLPLPSGHPS
jgi:amidase